MDGERKQPKEPDTVPGEEAEGQKDFVVDFPEPTIFLKLTPFTHQIADKSGSHKSAIFFTFPSNCFLVYIVVFLFFFLNEFASSIRKKEKRYGKL